MDTDIAVVEIIDLIDVSGVNDRGLHSTLSLAVPLDGCAIEHEQDIGDRPSDVKVMGMVSIEIHSHHHMHSFRIRNVRWQLFYCFGTAQPSHSCPLHLTVVKDIKIDSQLPLLMMFETPKHPYHALGGAFPRGNILPFHGGGCIRFSW